jgi:hypothetical protein
MNHGSLRHGTTRDRADEGERNAERSAAMKGRAGHANHQALCQFLATAISYSAACYTMRLDRANLCQFLRILIRPFCRYQDVHLS